MNAPPRARSGNEEKPNTSLCSPGARSRRSRGVPAASSPEPPAGQGRAGPACPLRGGVCCPLLAAPRQCALGEQVVPRGPAAYLAR